jgi:hypothetical protein
MTSHRISHLAAALAGLGEISRSYTARVKTGLSGLTTNMSATGKLREQMRCRDRVAFTASRSRRP